MTIDFRVTLVTACLLALSACDEAPSEGGPELSLELRGAAGEAVTLDGAAIRAMPAVSGSGGVLNTAGRITPPAHFKGVSLIALADRVGGVTDEVGLMVTALDGYEVTLSASQARGQVVTFDPSSGAPTTLPAPPTLALAYEREGAPLGDEVGGPLRVVVLSAEDEQISEGHLWVKSVARLTLVPAEPEWTLRLEGARAETISRSFFESGAAPGCHVSSWTDEAGGLWTGIPLWLLVGWVDDQNVHRAGAFNRELAAQGYPIELVTSDGARVTLGSDQVSLDDRILLAHRVDGEPLDEEMAPLRLVGAGLEPEERVGRVVEVVLHVP